MKRLTVRVSDREAEIIERLAKLLEMSKNDLIRQLVREGSAALDQELDNNKEESK